MNNAAAIFSGVALSLAVYGAADASPSPAADRALVQQWNDRFSRLAPSERVLVQQVATSLRRVQTLIDADQINLSRDNAALHLEELLNPEFRKLDTDGALSGARLSKARTLLQRAQDLRSQRDSQMQQVVSSSKLPPTIKQYYSELLGKLIKDARPMRDQIQNLLLRRIDVMANFILFLSRSKWESISGAYSFATDADVDEYSRYATEINSLTRNALEVELALRQRAITLTQ